MLKNIYFPPESSRNTKKLVIIVLRCTLERRISHRLPDYRQDINETKLGVSEERKIILQSSGLNFDNISSFATSTPKINFRGHPSDYRINGK